MTGHQGRNRRFARQDGARQTPKSNLFRLVSIWVVPLAMLALIAVHWLIGLWGYRSGLQASGKFLADLLTVSLFLMIPVAMYLLRRCLVRWSRVATVAACIFVFLFTSRVVVFESTYIVGGMQLRNSIARTEIALAGLSRIVENYRAENGYYPASLSAMGTMYFSPAPGERPARYFRFPGGDGYLLWYPGPNQDWNLTMTPELGEEIESSWLEWRERQVAEAECEDMPCYPQALIPFVCDPSNGRAKGDVILVSGV